MKNKITKIRILSAFIILGAVIVLILTMVNESKTIGDYYIISLIIGIVVLQLFCAGSILEELQKITVKDANFYIEIYEKLKKNTTLKITYCYDLYSHKSSELYLALIEEAWYEKICENIDQDVLEYKKIIDQENVEIQIGTPPTHQERTREYITYVLEDKYIGLNEPNYNIFKELMAEWWQSLDEEQKEIVKNAKSYKDYYHVMSNKLQSLDI